MSQELKRVDWTKPIEGNPGTRPCRLVEGFRCHEGTHAIKWDFGDHDVFALVNDFGQQCYPHGAIDKTSMYAGEVIIRNVPPAPVTVERWAIMRRNDCVHLYNTKDEATAEVRCGDRCEPFLQKFTYQPQE